MTGTGDQVTEQDRETHAAIEALAHRIRVRDAAIRAAEDCGDAEPFAAEFMAALRGRGWRLTPAKAQPEPHTAGAGTPQSPEVAELLAKVRAERDAAAAAWQAEWRGGAA
jgi:hypothetical protein